MTRTVSPFIFAPSALYSIHHFNSVSRFQATIRAMYTRLN
jgi:hypothetical protein